jgi:DNA-binding SARP family transcriptional activator
MSNYSAPDIRLKVNVRRFILLISLVLLQNPARIYSQSYGLGFYSHEVSKDLRTGLDLSPDKYLDFEKELELSFSFNLRSNEQMYFGYLFRIISEDGVNIDLIFNYKDTTSNFFTLIQGQNLIFRQNTDFRKLCDSWSGMKLKIDLITGQVLFITPDSTMNAKGLKFGKKTRFKILFGANTFGHFKTTDVPPMNVRDIKLIEKGKLIHYFPLDELEGNIAHDKSGKNEAKIHQPIWIRPEHFNWEKIFQTGLQGSSQVAFDRNNEDIILIGSDQVIRYSTVNNEASAIKPLNLNANLNPGCQAFYNASSASLYSFNIDVPSISSFDFEKLKWDQKNVPNNLETVFWQYNKFYYAPENSLYTFGGYGQYKYKNLVQKYSLSTNGLSTVKTSGDTFNPRYLGALGEMNDTIYILGGFGSISGDQIYSPHNYYDLMAFSLKDHKFVKKFEYDTPLEDMAFANSMIIDPEERSYYALAFPIYKYDGYLQLIKGSLSSPEKSFMGGHIPYLFSDIKSFADLFYCQRSKKLIAVTILSDSGKSKVSIYSLSFPPNQQILNPPVKKFFSSLEFILIVFGLVILGGAVFLFRILSVKRKYAPEVVEIKKSDDIAIATKPDAPLKQCRIQFFGEFQVFNESGKDITRKFTPLLKELFLLIWFNSIKNDTGISNEKLIEILWFDFSESNAHNNKAVNIAKLRGILSEICNCEVSQKTGYWKIDYNNELICNDYLEFIKIIRSQKSLSEQQVSRILEITGKGPFLSDLNYEWLDEFKSSVSNEIIDRLVDYSSKINIARHPDFIIQLTDSIFNFDSANEEAMIMKCKALISLGRHSSACDTYNKFAKVYKTLYGSDFEKSFAEISGQEIH